MKGLLYIDKPAGWTSFDVVNYVRKKVAQLEGKKPRSVKVGHTGTLDPAATGLLILAVGSEFTSQMPQLMKKDKTYAVELTLGMTSSTGDSEGLIEPIEVINPPEIADVQRVLLSFVGESMQIPPRYSAIKVNGKRAYELARAGKEVSLSPRPVTIYSIQLQDYSYPKLSFRCRVSSGTYIRSLAEDIGDRLRTKAYMSSLIRTAIGDDDLGKAISISDITEEYLQNNLAD